VNKGKEMLEAFVSSQFDGENEAKKSFYQPIPKSGLKTFKEMKKPW